MVGREAGDVQPGPEDLVVRVAGRRRDDEAAADEQRDERREADGAGADPGGGACG